jgi:hypothetical protein
MTSPPPVSAETAIGAGSSAYRPAGAATATPPPIVPPAAPAIAPKTLAPPVSPAGRAKVAPTGKKGLNAGIFVLAIGVLVLGALAVAGYLAWQRWQQPSVEQVAEQTPDTVPVEPQTLAPAVDPGVAPVTPAITQPAPTTAAKTVPKTTSTTPRPTQPATKYEPVPSPVPPTVVTPQLQVPAPAPPPLKPVLPPAMFGDAKWMRIEGSRVRETDAFLQVTDEDVRILDARARSTLLRIPYTAVTHVVYSSGKRPAWRTDVGQAPPDSVFDSTVRTYHYLAFQGASRFVLVRIDRDDLARLREELQKRADLTIETAR